MRVAALVALSAALLWFVVTVWAAFPLSPMRLSASSDVCDFEPRAAISADGQWLATAWIKGNMFNQGCISRGQALLRWGNEGAAQTNWSMPQTLSLPSDACAIHTDVALDGTTAHLAVSYWSPCDAVTANSALRYYTCNLLTGACTSGSDAVYQEGASGKRISDARIVLDTQSRPHIIYAQGTHALTDGDILSTRLNGGSWTAPVIVATGTKIGGFYRPVAAASGGRIHIAWERHRNDGNRSRGDVQYRYYNEDTGEFGTQRTFLYPDASLDETTYPLPALAARDGTVLLVWNVCADVNINFPCEKFYLLYVRSNDNGLSWVQPKEVGTEIPVTMINMSLKHYAGSDAQSVVSEYASHTRPVVALDHQGLPRLTWQVKIDSGYALTTTYVVSRTDQYYSWVPTTTWQVGAGGDVRIAPAIVLPGPAMDANGFHFIYMRAWMQQVGGQQYSRSQIYYDYYGGRRTGGEQVVADTYTDIHVLPNERAQLLRAQVRDLSGQGIGGAQLHFSVREGDGSFNLNGVDGTTTQRVTDPDGWAEVTLYTNLAGTVMVDAWLDIEANGVWDADEPAVVFTHTWTDNNIPALEIGPSWAISGDLMTTTLRLHPYSNEAYAGYPLQYAVWLCSQGDEDPLRIADSLSMNVMTWSRSNLVLEVPWGTTAGTYYLESHVDEGATGCHDAYVARSSTFTVGDEPPPGVPWITVSANKPFPGQVLQATLKYHEAGVYTLWWCPITGAAPISQKVKDGVTVPTQDAPTTTTFGVPSGVSGLYRLESHQGAGAACGNLDTRKATSGLLRSANQVYLPLVLRNHRH